MKKTAVKNSPKRERNKFAGLKGDKKGGGAQKKREWWRKPVEETESDPKNPDPAS